jgi:hypothetical protein
VQNIFRKNQSIKFTRDDSWNHQKN